MDASDERQQLLLTNASGLEAATRGFQQKKCS